MRLTLQEQSAIHTAVKQFFGDSAEVWLFGSRVDDNKKGGDIDLYIETDLDQTETFKREIKIRGALMRPLEERKVDIVVKSRKSAKALPIHQVAKDTGIRL